MSTDASAPCRSGRALWKWADFPPEALRETLSGPGRSCLGLDGVRGGAGGRGQTLLRILRPAGGPPVGRSILSISCWFSLEKGGVPQASRRHPRFQCFSELQTPHPRGEPDVANASCPVSCGSRTCVCV